MNWTLAGLLALTLAAQPPAEQAPIESPQGGYSVEPLRNPLFDEAQVRTEATAIDGWLKANKKLAVRQLNGPREYLYYLIDSRVKALYATEGRVLPTKGDPTLERLFSWSEDLGVFGGAQAYNAVKAPSSPPKSAKMKLPEGVTLNIDKDMFVLESKSGWSFSVPYYFMIWNVADVTPPGGPRTQLVALSTGAAKDKSQAGRSQATLMFLFTPDKQATFEQDWLGRMGISADLKPKALGVKTLEARHFLDESVKLHKELTSWSEPAGSFVVAYLGIEGTYQWNRPHFLDFLRSIKTSPSSQPNDAPRPDEPRSGETAGERGP